MAASTDSGTSEPSVAQGSTSTAAASGSRQTRNTIRFDSDLLSFGGKRKVSGASGADMDDDDDDEDKGKPGRRKIDIEYIQDKSKRHITFSKRKAGIMKKAYELSTLTGTQVLLLVVSETGLVYTYTTAKLQPLVTDTPGKKLIAACLGNNAGDEDDDEGEEPEEAQTHPELHVNDAPAVEMHSPPMSAESPSPQSHHFASGMPLPAHQPSLSPYGDNAPLPPAPYANGHGNAPSFPHYDPNYPMSQPMAMYGGGLSAPMAPYTSLAPSTISPPEPSHVAAASYLNPGRRPSHGPDRSIKRRRTEGDLRSRSRSAEPLPPFPGQAPPVPSLPLAFAAEAEAPLPHLSYASRRQACEANAAQQTSQAQSLPTLHNLAESFVWSVYARDTPLFLPVTSFGDAPAPADQHMREFRAQADRIPILGGEPGWIEGRPLGTDEVASVAAWYAEHLLPTLTHRSPFFKANSCDTLADFLAHVYNLFDLEPPVHANKELKMFEMHFMEQHLADHPPPDLGARKPASKMKPRRGQNPVIREPRVRRMLTELGFWNIGRKTDFLGNRKGRRMAGLFRVERIRRTFVVCEPLELEDGSSGANLSYLKLRVPLAAPKLLRRGDKLRLHIRCHDDGSEWNVVAYDGSDLTPEPEEDEEDRLDEHQEYTRAIKRGMNELQAKSFARRQAGIKQILDSGELPADGFESAVPPKGGKQAFRVKPGTAVATATYGAQFEGAGEDSE